MAVPHYKYSGVVYTATADQKTFALTTEDGEAIEYLKKSHIRVRTSTDSGENWTTLTIDDDYKFNSAGTKIVLNTGVAASTLVDLARQTPLDDDYIDFQSGSLLTSAQLNEFDSWQLYIDQELKDGQLHMSGQVFPGVEGLITEEEAEKDPENPKWEGDSKLPTVGAAERVYANLVGKGTGYPGTGNKGKHGKIRIDHDSSLPDLFFWNEEASPPTWQQVATQGKAGSQGPKGDPPGLQDPPQAVSNVPNKGDGTVGDATVVVEQDLSGDLKFTFGIPEGEKGDKGDTGDGGAAATVDVGDTTTGNAGTSASVTNSGTTTAAVFEFTIPRGDTGATGPAPGLQAPATAVSNVENKDATTVGDATAEVEADGDGDLKFTFGIPVGLKGDKGDTGTGITYKGVANFTDSSAEPNSPINGDYYVNNTQGTGDWTGISVAVEEGDRAIYNGTSSQWDLLPKGAAVKVDLGYTAAADRGHVTNTAGTDATITAVTDSNAGLMLPAQKTKLDGIDAGAEANWAEPTDDGNLYARTRAAGSSSGAWQQVASNPITGVTGGSGIDVTGVGNRTVAIDYGQGVEDDGSDQLTVKLDGTTLTKSDNGLRVNADYKPGSAGEADQLSTARTLWGQDFDGTANVSGDMTSVGNITFSGAQAISTNGDNALTINTGTADATFSGDVVIQAGGAIQLNNTNNDASIRHLSAGDLGNQYDLQMASSTWAKPRFAKCQHRRVELGTASRPELLEPGWHASGAKDCRRFTCSEKRRSGRIYCW